MRLADRQMHQPVHGNRRLPGKGAVDPERLARLVDQEILRPSGEAERRAVERTIGVALLAARRRARRDRLGIGRFVAPGAGRIDRADQHLQHMDRAAAVEAVGMRRDAAHRVDRDGAAEHRLVTPPRRVGPGLLQHDRLVEGDFRDLGGDAADRLGRARRSVRRRPRARIPATR